jgi:hypothetical protein
MQPLQHLHYGRLETVEFRQLPRPRDLPLYFLLPAVPCNATDENDGSVRSFEDAQRVRVLSGHQDHV